MRFQTAQAGQRLELAWISGLARCWLAMNPSPLRCYRYSFALVVVK